MKMKKLLLIAFLGIIVFSCKKDKCEDQSAINYNQEGDCIYNVPTSIIGNWTTTNQEQIINISFIFNPSDPPLFELDTNIVVDPMWPIAIDIESDSIIFYDIDTSQAKYFKSGNIISVYDYENIYNIDTLDFIIDNVTNNSLTLFAMLDLNILNTDSLLNVYFEPATASQISGLLSQPTVNIEDYASIQMKWDFQK
jgi:hypothetical protein